MIKPTARGDYILIHPCAKSCTGWEIVCFNLAGNWQCMMTAETKAEALKIRRQLVRRHKRLAEREMARKFKRHMKRHGVEL